MEIKTRSDSGVYDNHEVVTTIAGPLSCWVSARFSDAKRNLGFWLRCYSAHLRTPHVVNNGNYVALCTFAATSGMIQTGRSQYVSNECNFSFLLLLTTIDYADAFMVMRVKAIDIVIKLTLEGSSQVARYQTWIFVMRTLVDIEKKMKELKWKKDSTLEELKQGEQTLKHVRYTFEVKRQEFFRFMDQSSPYAMQLWTITDIRVVILMQYPGETDSKMICVFQLMILV
ncbi:hypothetical protein CTI12_AA131230 [Artemisia annua]|uniref:Uncharacterized protein n=1 Tax=Artemisia annua TaxID=35608 RepID=A0A2U1PLV1_ARTAN|nr:hypothetical protein CTI12_AA131230 [Artemisia annua]